VYSLSAFRFSCRNSIIASGVIFLVGAIIIGLYFRAHLSWQLTRSRVCPRGLHAIPVKSMPMCEIPDTWMRCREAGLEFSLPPDLASHRSVHRGGSVVTFQNGERAMTLIAAHSLSDYSSLLRVASDINPIHGRMSLPRLRLDCYSADTDEFRWSMTSGELRWHAFLVSTSGMLRLAEGGHVEAILTKDLDAVAHFVDKRVIFDWQCVSRLYGGYIHFSDRGRNSSQDWIRSVCESMTVPE
jgi:hypothetical protein